MSIKKTASHSHKPTPKKAEAPKPKTDTPKANEAKKDNDGAKKLNEVAKDGAKPGEAKDGKDAEAVKKPQQLDENGNPIKDPAKTDDGKEPKDEFKESDELKGEKDENQEMREEIQGLKDALASLYDMMREDEEKKEEKPESLGGCCGKSQGSKGADEGDGNKDWNAVLTAGIAAVKAQGLGGGNVVPLQGGQSGQSSNGQQGKQGAVAALGQNGKAAGAKGGGDARAKLASDYEKAQAAKAELRPEVENEVRSLLGMPPKPGQEKQGQGQGTPGMPMASGF
jgi:hypothetical protein